MVHCSVFIGNIPYNATEKQLIEICEEIGPVVSFRLVRDKDTGKPKGYGFCEYFGEDAALSAERNLKGYLIGGRELRVHLAQHGNKLAQKTADPAARQPLSESSALPTVSTMTGALGGTESRLANQQGPDPLTNYLQKMSKSQLLEIITEIKLMAAHNDPLVRQYLHQNPVLLKAQNQLERVEWAGGIQQVKQIIGLICYCLGTMYNINTNPDYAQLFKVDGNGLYHLSGAEVMLGLATPTMMQMASSISNLVVPQNLTLPVQVSLPQHQILITGPERPFQDTSQFSYSRRVGAATPVDLLTEVKSLSELHPAKIRKISNFRLH